MLTIRSDQMRAFQQAAISNYIAELAIHCRWFSPHLVKTLHDDELKVALRQGIDLAKSHGFDQRGPVRLYIDTMIVLGSGFGCDPQYPWAAEILAENGEFNQMVRAKALFAKIQRYLAQVDGVDNVYTRQSLADLATLCRSGVTFRPETLEPDLLRLMSQTHPRKVAASGNEALRALIADGVTQGREHYGFRETRSLALMVVLKFTFGHRCDCDPFHPWIARTLSKSGGASPDDRAEKLERRALIWLDAVLSNTAKDA